MLSMWCVLLLCLSVRVGGRLVQSPDLWYLETFNNGDTLDHSTHDHAYPQQSSAAEPRVLAVDLPLQSAAEPLRLRTASQQETELFEEIVQPIELVSEQRRQVGVGAPRDRPRVVTARGLGAAAGDQQLVDQIRNTVNKFIARGAGDRGQELADALAEETNPTLTVYVGGPYGVLVLNAETHVHRWVLRPPSPLPRWLHAQSAAGSAADERMPEGVQSELYRTLTRLAKVFLRFDL